MVAATLRREERVGLGVAVAAHVGLLLILVLRPAGDVVAPPERIEVTLSDDVGIISTSPDPYSDAAPDIAPEIGEAPLPSIADDQPLLPPRVAEPQEPAPAPAPAREQATQRPSRPSPPARSTPAPRPAKKAGGSRIGSDFLEGVEGAESNERSSSPAAEAIGPKVQAALSGAISRQLRPHWAAPQGADADQLVTILAWELNRDGSLAGSPRVVRQLGVNDANSAQKGRHAEQAIRAVRLAAPFNLPDEYYDAWKRIAQFRFDKRLSQ